MTLVPVVVALIVVTLAAGPAAAQSTRVEAIAEEQRAKAARLAPEDANTAEQVVVRILNSPLLSGDGGAYPWFGSVYAGTGFAAGGGYLRRLAGGGSLHGVAGLSVTNSKLLEGRFTAPGLWRGLLRIDGVARWFDARDLDFYGLGQDTPDEHELEYDMQPAEAGVNATVTPIRGLHLTAGYSRLDIRSNPDTPDDPDDVPRTEVSQPPGLGVPLGFHVTRATLAVDWRTSPGYSTRGGFYRVTRTHHAESSGRPFSFDTTEMEVVQLVPLVREQFVLAARGVMTLTSAGAGQDVPFMLTPHLGGGSTLRGFANRRFTDRHRALVTGEYRWRPSRYLDMAVFLDAGQVAGTRHDFDLGAFDTSWGLGARFHGPTFTALRIEVARSREGVRLLFSGGQVF